MTDQDFLDSLLTTSTVPCNLYELTSAYQLLRREVVRLRAVDVANKEYIAEKPLVGAYHNSPDGCPIWHDGCNCTVEALAHNINRAERAENEVVRLRDRLRKEHRTES